MSGISNTPTAPALNTAIVPYVHQDMTTVKGVVGVRVGTNKDDFTTRSKPVADYAKRVAMYAFATGTTDMTQIVEAFPDLQGLLADAEAAVKAKISILEIVVLK